MNGVLDKSSSLRSQTNGLNNSKIKFIEPNKLTVQSAKGLNNSTNTNQLTNNNKILTNKQQQKSLNNSQTTHNASINRLPVKKPIIEYNGVGDNQIDSEKTTLYSTWTPLSDDQTNNKLFEERRQLLNKWFENWSDRQRKDVIEDIFNSCKPKQLVHAREKLNQIAPIYHNDFTRILPRVISLYIFSFLDPRSLSRCAQVCWYWKTLTELDILWMPKCLRFNWILNYKPTPFETGIWKRFYIENIKAIQYVPTKEVPSPLNTDRSELTIEDIKKGKFNWNSSFNRSKINIRTLNNLTALDKRPPWKANSFNPGHLYRLNYLDDDKNEALEKRRNDLIKTLSLDSTSNRPASNTLNKKKENAVNSKTTIISKNNENLNTSATKINSNRPASQQNNHKATTTGNTISHKNSNSNLNSTLNNSSRPQSTSTFNENKKTAWKLLNGSDDEV